MQKQVVGILSALLLTAAFTVANLGGTSLGILEVRPAAATDFTNPKERQALLSSMLRKARDENCGSRNNDVEALMGECGYDMFPLNRKSCIAKFKEIQSRTSCRDPDAPSAMMISGNKCKVYRKMDTDMCGASMADEFKEDCALAKKYIKAEC